MKAETKIDISKMASKRVNVQIKMIGVPRLKARLFFLRLTIHFIVYILGFGVEVKHLEYKNARRTRSTSKRKKTRRKAVRQGPL